MKKNIIMKGVLLLIILAILSIVFAGCSPIIITPTTGTVYLVVTGSWWYDLYMDTQKKYSNEQAGTYVIYNVPTGNRFFEAIDTAGWELGYDSVTQYIHIGVNHVYLNP